MIDRIDGAVAMSLVAERQARLRKQVAQARLGRQDAHDRRQSRHHRRSAWWSRLWSRLWSRPSPGTGVTAR
jgi:hypothetical protein